jgi:hypothetical protein
MRAPNKSFRGVGLAIGSLAKGYGAMDCAEMDLDFPYLELRGVPSVSSSFLVKRLLQEAPPFAIARSLCIAASKTLRSAKRSYISARSAAIAPYGFRSISWNSLRIPNKM